MRLLAVDVDNTIADYTKGLRAWLRAHGSTMPMPEPDDYDFSRASGWSLPDGFTAAHRGMVADSGYLLLDPMPYAVAAVRRLRSDGWSLVAVTGREREPMVTEQTRQWCALAGIDRVVFAQDKTAACHGLRATAMVGDNPADLIRLYEGGVRVLKLNHGYNRGAPGEPCTDWHAVCGRLS